MSKDFKVPELGENVKSATVAKVLIARGDTIKREQPVVELETDKAVVEVPSDVEGTVEDIRIKEGDEVKVGQTLFTVESAGSRPHDDATEHGGQGVESEEREPMRVPERQAEAPPPGPEATAASGEVPAAPSVRRFAREIGVDIRAVVGSGPAGRISLDDVKTQARSQAAGTRVAAPPGGALPLPDLTPWGQVEREPMTRVRRLTAERMSYAWSTIPHVTQFGRADVTDMEGLRQQYKEDAEKAGGHLSLLVILIKTVASALKAFPRFNAGVDLERHELVYRKYCHIGVAMDTDRGLVVPVIRDVDRKNVIETSVDLARITAKARAGKLSVDDMRGGCFTLSNAGALGGDVFTPIINWPEVAILGMARARTEAVYRDNVFLPRLLLPLSLSYDHRVIDGADGVRFIQWIVEALESPVKLLWEG